MRGERGVFECYRLKLLGKSGKRRKSGTVQPPKYPSICRKFEIQTIKSRNRKKKPTA
jgi:hypothetical protein